LVSKFNNHSYLKKMNNEKKNGLTKQIIKTLIILLLLFLIGIIGYMYFEQMNIVDAFYMTIISVTTTGMYSGPALSVEGKIFTVFLIITGIIVFVQGINILATAIINDYFNTVFKKRRLYQMMKDYKNHIIVCGCGELGFEVVKEINNKKERCIVIDKNPQIKQKLELFNFTGIFLEGDAANDEI